MKNYPQPPQPPSHWLCVWTPEHFKPCSSEKSPRICFLNHCLKNVSMNNTTFHHLLGNPHQGFGFCVYCDKLGRLPWKCSEKPRILDDLPGKSPSLENLNKDQETDSGSKPQTGVCAPVFPLYLFLSKSGLH